MSSTPVETKVTAATAAGAGSAGVITPFVVWLVGEMFFADGAVPLPLVGMIGLLVTGASTFVAGWLARHTPRPDLDVPAGQPSGPAAVPPERTGA